MIATIVLLAISAAAAPASRVLPSVTVQTLSGEKVVLPRDLGQASVFVAGFTKASRAETEPWAQRLRADPRVSTKVRIYEVSILDGVPGFLRGMILSQMKTGVAALRQAQFLVVTDAVDSWKRALDTAGNDDHAALMLVQPTGVVVWRGHGALSESTYQELLREIGGKR
jgi:hypothetical protein